MKTVLLSVLLALAAAFSARAECGVNDTNQTVTIGGLFSVHTSKEGRCGKIREPSFVNVQAMMYAVQQINADPDLLPNIILAHDIRDTCGMSNQALEQTVELLEIKRGGGGEQDGSLGISGVVGAALSDVSITVASLLRIFQVPQISHSSTAAVLSNKRQFDYFLRTIPPDSFQARAMASIIAHFGWSYVIGVHTDDTYGRGGIRSLEEELERSNETRVCLVMDEATAIPLHASRPHYDQTLRFIRKSWISNASVVVLFVQRHNALELFDAIEAEMAEGSAGRYYYDHITWVASDSWATRLPQSYHERARGMLGVVPVSHHVEGFVDYFESLTLAEHSEEPWFAWFAEFWESHFNCSLDNNSNGWNACDTDSQMLSYSNATGNGAEYVMDAVYAFAHAIQNLMAGSCPNRSCLCEEITMQRFSRRALNGTLLREHLYNVSFESLTSHEVKFDKSGDQEGFYNIVNLGRNGVRNVGTWNSKNHLEIDTGKIEWRGGGEGSGGGGGADVVPQSMCSLPCGDGEERVGVLEQSDCCWTCERCPASDMYSAGDECATCVAGTSPNQHRNACKANPIVHLTWSDGWAVVIQLGALLGLAATAFVVVVFIVFNKHKIVKAACRELCAILLTGIALCYILPFFFIAAPSPATCAIRRFSVGFCFSLCFAPLLMKTNRIYRVFHKAPHTPRFAGPKSQVVFTCLLVSVQAIVGAVWLIADRPGVKPVYYPNATERICDESLYVGLPIYLLYNLFLLTLSTFYAFLARKIPAKFNETKFIGATLYSICVIWLAFIPTYFASIIRLGAIYITGTLVSAILLSATTTLVCLFIPKVVFVFADLKNGKKDTRRLSLSRGSISTDFTIGAAEISSATHDYKLSTNNSNTDVRVCTASESECGTNNSTID